LAALEHAAEVRGNGSLALTNELLFAQWLEALKP
jgi:hypothetical protein